jgi:hypothetical protein
VATETPTVTTRTGQLSSLRPRWASQVPNQADEKIKLYAEMLDNDADARQALDFFTNRVLNLIGEYSHDDEKLQEFVQQALGRINSYTQSLRWLLRAPILGFAVCEKVWRQQDGQWLYDAMIPVSTVSLSYDGIHMERALGQPKEVVQWARSGAPITIPGDKVVHWAYQDAGDGYGTPIARGTVQYYAAKKTLFGMYQIGMERLAEPLIYEVIPNTEVQVGTTPTPLADVLAETWKNAQGGSVQLRPTPMEWAEKGIPRAEVLRAGEFGRQFLDFFDYCFREYLTALGIPPLVFMEAQFGTRAQSSVQADVADLAALPVAEEFVDNCLMRDVVKPLIEVNFGPQDDYGTFPVTLPMNEAALASLVQTLSRAGYTSLMVHGRVYAHMQKLVPHILPELTPEDYGGEPQRPAQPVGGTAPI